MRLVRIWPILSANVFGRQCSCLIGDNINVEFVN